MFTMALPLDTMTGFAKVVLLMLVFILVSTGRA
jgi:hypothetical protein